MLATLAVAGLLAGAYAHPEQLVDTAWVAAHAADADIRIVDMRRDGFDAGHVPGAVHLDPTAIRDSKNVPSFTPTPEAFEAMMGRLGISNATRVIVYDDRGGVYAARLWWALNYFGHGHVALMDGGWTKWSAEKRAVATDPRAPAPATFRAQLQPRWLAVASDVVAAAASPFMSIIDARTADEIAGKNLPNSTPVKRGGRIPASVPIYWEDLLNADRTFKSADELRQIFERKAISPGQEIIVYCLVGMRASVDLFALHLLGYEKLRNYYGAWEEWGNRDDLPLAEVSPLF
ncbi:MAG: sulfurtransferase [Vicinamibacterales bacterium]